MRWSSIWFKAEIRGRPETKTLVGFKVTVHKKLTLKQLAAAAAIYPAMRLSEPGAIAWAPHMDGAMMAIYADRSIMHNFEASLIGADDGGLWVGSVWIDDKSWPVEVKKVSTVLRLLLTIHEALFPRHKVNFVDWPAC